MHGHTETFLRHLSYHTLIILAKVSAIKHEQLVHVPEHPKKLKKRQQQCSWLRSTKNITDEK